jgi:predicted nucleic-acid-binding Zn-ribbon protein
MANTTCPKCDSHNFELIAIEPSGSRYKHNLIQCSNCGAPAGALEYINTGALIGDIQEALGKLDQKVVLIAREVQKIADHLAHPR